MVTKVAGPAVLPGYVAQNLFVLRNADFTSTADQFFVKQGAFTKYVITNVIAINKTGSYSIACLGGIYAAASKGGDILVLAATSWAALSALSLVASVPTANIIQKVETATPILSLTTGNTGALTGDIFISGVIVD